MARLTWIGDGRAIGAARPDFNDGKLAACASCPEIVEIEQDRAEANRRRNGGGGGPGVSLLTAGEVADVLGVPVSWVYEQSRRGRIPTITLGRYRRYRLETIERWVDELEAGQRRGPPGALSGI